MRSVYTKTLISSLMILALSFLVFVLIARASLGRSFEEGMAFGGLLDEQSAEAERQYNLGGRDALAKYLDFVARQYPGTRRLFLDSRAHNVLTGADETRQLDLAVSIVARLNPFVQVAIRKNTPDSKYILLFEPATSTIKNNILSYFAILPVAIVLLCVTFRYQFVLPLVRLTEVVRRFGGGDLSARLRSKRKDELGELGRAFDDMASRIETLLTAERRLLQDISHELRSPLARLKFATELARTSSDRDSTFARVNKEIDRLTELIQSLIQVTRAEGDLTARNLQTVAVHQLLKEIVEDSEIEARRRSCRLNLDVSRKLTLCADRELLRRAIENIVRNAIHHAPERTDIEIELGSSSSGAFISVRDSGSGVPDEHLEAIFRPFYRVDDSRAEATGGVGLGLAIAERAIRVHHGNVWAENGNPGLRVCIEFPSTERQ
jgi:two-component system, OmpR family, sensor histidine kinase CpxA